MTHPAREREARRLPFGEPLGPWTALHALGAAIVLLLFAALAMTCWLGWPRVAAWMH